MPEPNRPQYEPRVTVAYGIAIVLSLGGALESYRAETALARVSHDPWLVSAQEPRLAGVLATVPKTATVGYLSDLSTASEPGNGVFSAARYTLAPRLLIPDTTPEWVLGNFSRAVDYKALGEAKGLNLVQDFGGGAVLYRRRAR